MVQELINKLKFETQDKSKRIYVMTTDFIYTFKDGKKARQYHIKDVGAIIISKDNKTDFMLFFQRSDDLIISSPNRKDMLDLLKLRFNCLNRNITLRVYAVTEKELKTLIKNNDASSKAAGIIDLPEDSARLLDDEIKGEEEYNASLRAKKADIEDSPFDFDDNTGFKRQGSMGQANMTIDNHDDDIRASVMVGSRREM